MSMEYTALATLKTWLQTAMDATPETNLTASQIVIGYPDQDKMPYPVMLYIVPEGGQWQRTTTENIEEQFSLKLYFMVKQSATHTSMTAQVQAVFEYFGAFANAMNYDGTCGHAFDDSAINSWDFYPAVEGMTNTVGLDVSITLLFERDPIILPGDSVVPSPDLTPFGG